MMQPNVCILTSGIGLGVYIPSVLIEQRLRADGIGADVYVLEGYFTAEHQQRHLAHKEAFHDNFDLALMAHRMARGVEQSLEREQVSALLRAWRAERRTRFIVWSGFWLPILEQYRRELGSDIDIDCCRIDATVSASFRAHEALDTGREIWLWSWDRRRTELEIPVDHEAPVPFSAREQRLVVHGGGWGLGTYRDALARLRGSAYAFDVVVHADSEAGPPNGGDRYYRVEPSWRTWHRTSIGHTFPPFGEVGTTSPVTEKHALYDVVRRSRAIVSKPGGGTLIDSLSSATPVVLLEPYGYAEERNGALWAHLGYGISFAKWRDTGFDVAVLERLHENLITRKKGIDYCSDYARRVRAAAA